MFHWNANATTLKSTNELETENDKLDCDANITQYSALHVLNAFVCVCGMESRNIKQHENDM